LQRTVSDSAHASASSARSRATPSSGCSIRSTSPDPTTRIRRSPVRPRRSRLCRPSTAERNQRRLRAYLRDRYLEHATARYTYAIDTEEPFRERLVHFWTNHFAVSADKLPIQALAGTLEAEVIRPNVTGRFADMLVSVEQHPAMISYLDNQTSMGPSSTVARAASRRGRERGLNENLAREILELHTLGVDGGYRQADVTAFANVLTGWSIDGGGALDRGRGDAGDFVFRPGMHEPGPQIVLGGEYAQPGIEQGESVLADLAANPSTARYLATKLARHFVADAPPEAVVARLAAAYLDNDGRLSAVYAALVESPEAWSAPFAKYKTPHDFVISALRAFGRHPDVPNRIVASLDGLGQRPYTPGSPAGWPDTAAHWDGADALMRRIEWAAAIGGMVGDRVQPEAVAEALVGPLLGDHTRTAVARAESAAQGLALFLASPEFQRR
jgi:uncharacterized protein (DUF1800 family)